MTIDVSQVNALAVDLGKAPAAVVAKTSTAIRKTAADIEADAKILAPVDTGFLEGSVTSTVRGLHAEIGPTAAYGVFQEYGTSSMAPQPFMGPAFDRRAPGLEQALTQIAGDVL